MPWGAVIAGGASLASGLIGSNAAGNAADKQQQAAQQADQLLQGNYDVTSGNLSPFISGGTNALKSLSSLLSTGGNGANNPVLSLLGIGMNGQPTGGGINPAAFENSPGYQFQLQQGTDAVTNSAAARGGLGGNALKALQSYGSGLANQSWNQYLGNVSGGWNSLISQLTGLAGLGENAGSSLGNIGAGLAGGMSNAIQGGGNAASAGTIGSANALTGGFNGLINNLNTGGLSSNNGGGINALLNSLFSSSGGGYGSSPNDGQMVNTSGWG